MVRIDRAIAETRKLQQESDKFVAEQRKLQQESDKLGAEQRKLAAESRKLSRDTSLAPFTLAVTAAGAGAALFAAGGAFFRLMQ